MMRGQKSAGLSLGRESTVIGVTGLLSKVYLLQHYYDYGKESEHEEVKELGVYSTRELAEEARDRYATLPGFRDFPLDCFFIAEPTLDEDAGWEEGFVSC